MLILHDEEIIYTHSRHVNVNAYCEYYSCLPLCHIIGIRKVIAMEIEGFGERLARLLVSKGVSARDLSLSIGKSGSYINSIMNNNIYPSMPSFFMICEQLGVSKAGFFSDDFLYPEELSEMIHEYTRADEESQAYIRGILKKMNE